MRMSREALSKARPRLLAMALGMILISAALFWQWSESQARPEEPRSKTSSTEAGLRFVIAPFRLKMVSEAEMEIGKAWLRRNRMAIGRFRFA